MSTALGRRVINGQLHKLCTGPAHDEPTWLPATDKYFYKYKSGKNAGRLTSRCRLCNDWHELKSPGEVGYVSLREAKHFVVEAVNRVGAVELAKRSGVHINTISNILNGHTKSIQKRTLKKLMLELVSIKRKGEYSISPEAARNVVRRMNGYQPVCVGCGIALSDYTSDCETCQERKRKRRERGLTDEEA